MYVPVTWAANWSFAPGGTSASAGAVATTTVWPAGGLVSAASGDYTSACGGEKGSDCEREKCLAVHLSCLPVDFRVSSSPGPLPE